jgi:PhnB protein
MTLTSYLFFDGTCREAFEFYARALDAKIEAMSTYGDKPPEAEGSGDPAEGCGALTPESRDRIMHAYLARGDSALMGSDSMPGQPFEGIKGCSVAIGTSDAAEAERVFHALAEGGNVTMPLQATFWAERFGMLVDRFGVSWMVNCMKPA